MAGIIISIICLLIVSTITRAGPIKEEPPLEAAQASSKSEQKVGRALSNKELWKFNFALFFGFIPFMSVTTYWVAWLMSSKAISSEVAASTITSLVGIAGIFGTIISGYIGARIRRNKPVFVIPAVITGLALLGFVFIQGIDLIIFMSIIVGLASYMLCTIMFAIPPQLVSRKFTGTALGIAMVFFYSAGIFGPIIVGTVYSYSGGLVLPGIVMLACMVVAAIFVQSMKVK